MNETKQFYKNYLADDSISPLSERLITEILKENPNHVLEFGCGTGKHLKVMDHIATCGLDISFLNITRAYSKDLPFIIMGDDTHLRHLCNFDVVFTCSVLDHVFKIDEIVNEFKRIANKSVIIAETQVQDIQNHYFSHNYEKHGFVPIDFSWMSPKPEGDGNVYRIWKWNKPQ